jgi:hypothetical protein
MWYKMSIAGQTKEKKNEWVERQGIWKYTIRRTKNDKERRMLTGIVRQYKKSKIWIIGIQKDLRMPEIKTLIQTNIKTKLPAPGKG